MVFSADAGSLAVAEDWLADILRGDWEAAWNRIEPAYRRVLAERAAAADGFDLGDPHTLALVSGAAEEGQDDDLWLDFAEAQGRTFLDALPEAFDDWRWITCPAPVALDCELVLMFDEAGARAAAEVPEDQVPRLKFELVSPVATDSPPWHVVTSGTLFYMRRDDCGGDDYGEWLIAGLNEEPPDWPTPS